MGDQLKDPFSTPRCGRDGQQSESLVNLSTPGIVKPCDHTRDLENVPRDTGGYDIGVIRSADGGEGIAGFNACLHQHVAIEPQPSQKFSFKIRTEAVFCIVIMIDHGNIMPMCRHYQTDLRPDASATHYNDFHNASSPFQGLPNRWLPGSATHHGFSKPFQRVQDYRVQ